MKILIIEDEKLLCDSIRQILLFKGFTNVTVCYDALEGEREINKNIYDIILIDLMMPQKNGDIILEESKKNGIKSEFIVLTAISDIPMVVKCLKAGAFNYMLKPPAKDLIIESINNAYRHFVLKNNLEIFTINQDTQKIPSEYEKFFTTDSNLKKILLYSDRLAKSECPVFISGASGTGKTLLAEAIHKASSRKDKNFVSININAIPDNLFESELFGYKKGAFTGAADNKQGLCKTADGGTLFIDEIGDLSIHNQIKLLKVIEEKKFYPVGSNILEKSDFRLITATSKNLTKEISAGNFRNELFYRINIGNIYLPNLKDRGQDILHISKKIIHDLNAINNMEKKISLEIFNILLMYDFPGNYRELKNILESAYYKCEDNLITENLIDIKPNITVIENIQTPKLTLENVKEQYIKKVIHHYEDKNKAAEILGVSLRQLYKYLKKYGL